MKQRVSDPGNTERPCASGVPVLHQTTNNPRDAP